MVLYFQYLKKYVNDKSNYNYLYCGNKGHGYNEQT